MNFLRHLRISICEHLRESIFFSQINADLFLAEFTQIFPGP
jgi:hypothetical protein